MGSRKIDIKLTPDEVRNICGQFAINDTSVVYDTEREYIMKKAMESLNKSDWVIFCLYAELQSERKLAELLGVSRTPIGKELARIKAIMKEKMGEEDDACD